MSLEESLHEELLGLYERTGRATGYWPNYFLRSVREKGGLKAAKQLLAPGSVSQGFDRLVSVQRADLSIEHIASSKRYRSLFTEEELETARRRLAEVPAEAWPAPRPDRLLPNELTPDDQFEEGAVKRIKVNRYERDPRARAACLRAHGTRCKVCDLDFEEQYGDLGRGFIHVHHLRPLAGPGSKTRVDPKKDLLPVCPNCHAMLHRTTPPLDIETLRLRLRGA